MKPIAIYRAPHVKKSTMDFFMRVLRYSLLGEIPAELYQYHEPKPNRFFYSEEDVKSVQSTNDAWELVELGIELWQDISGCFQSCESLQLLLEATTEHNVIVSFDRSIEASYSGIPTERHSVSYLSHTQGDLRFADVENHREWMKVAYQIVAQYVASLSQRVEAAKSLLEQMVKEAVTNVPVDSQILPDNVSDRSSTRVSKAKVPQEAAFENVREYFISSPDEVLRVIRLNEGTIHLRSMYIYEAAMILEPLKKHFRLSSTRMSRGKIVIDGMKEFHWFDKKRTLHNCLKASKDSHGSNNSTHDLMERTRLFVIDLGRFLPLKTATNSPKTPQ